MAMTRLRQAKMFWAPPGKKCRWRTLALSLAHKCVQMPHLLLKRNNEAMQVHTRAEQVPHRFLGVHTSRQRQVWVWLLCGRHNATSTNSRRTCEIPRRN